VNVRGIKAGDPEECTSDPDVEVREPVEKTLGKCGRVGEAVDMDLRRKWLAQNESETFAKKRKWGRKRNTSTPCDPSALPPSVYAPYPRPPHGCE
jgi:hypothetical protein